ncbi:ABC transporter, permease protein [Treponema socranskii subsp. socranskii VPI DR56BR1116 = ATCC 35536]|uniref:ABC transporter, permease protein n=1 Tax=Treponema socranskii subsp. socranskii VPI DR56BR1116 = ATCC 35536 TaxID=1125725 RepID=U1GY30_TRESO|nr:sugar ABC transporter permease [Treponema socranskii]ERF61459.1 ABC transporter, permease protein [Treponema socranskii subsp. socranskii VPI DR56BR1116 = ATCC 35536]
MKYLETKNKYVPYALVAPAVLIVLFVVFIPVLNAVLMSFQNYDLRRPKEIGFIGMKNYIDMCADPLFWGALFRTIAWVGFGVGFQFLFGFCLALLLNRYFIGRGFVRSISMIPWVTPGVLIGLMWRWIFDGNLGVLNDLLLRTHIIQEKIPFLSQTSTAFPCVIVKIIWQGIPFFALMILAGLQQVPGELYEAAEMDGAKKVQQLLHVTIPSLKNTLSVTLLLRIIWVANSVDVIFNMTEGGPAYSTQTLSVYIYNKGNALNLGYASTMAILLAVLLSLVAVPYVRSTFKGEN